MTTYQRGDDDVIRLLDETMKTHHKRLVDAGVTVQVLAASPELKLRGVKRFAVIKSVPLKSRVQGMADAELVIDGERWPLLSRKQRIAILDHELTHLVPREKKGKIDLDDHGRPKLGMRLHDQEFGWFDEVAERHGKDSIEVQQAELLMSARGQLYFAFVTQKAAA